MERRQLEVFLAVHEHGSLAAAARHLHVSQPALSQTIKSLEREAGTELFFRLPRGLLLTPAGEAILDSARQVFRDLRTIRALLDDTLGLETGHLDLVSLPGLANEPLAGWLGSYRSRFPTITIRILQMETPRGVIDTVRSGEAELGFVFGSNTPVQDLESAEVGSQELVALLPGDAQLATDRDAVTLDELIRFGLITGKPGTLIRDLAAQTTDSSSEDWAPVIEIERREASLSLVLAGAGAAVLPRSSGVIAQSLGARIRELKPRLIRRVWMVHRRGALSPAARALSWLIVDGEDAASDAHT